MGSLPFYRVGWYNVLVEIEDSRQAPSKGNHAAIETAEGARSVMTAVLQVQTHRVVAPPTANDVIASRRNGVCAALCSSRLRHNQYSLKLPVKNNS